jgi:hypothetical protein
MSITYEQSKVDPCLYFSWEGNTFIILVAWVDDVMILGPPVLVEKVKGARTTRKGIHMPVQRDSCSVSR